MTKCAACPVAGPDCEGSRVPRMCVLAETRPDYRRKLRELAGEAAPLKMPTRAERARVNLCLYRECRTGCERSTCWAMRKGTRYLSDPFTEVTMAECVECMAVNAE